MISFLCVLLAIWNIIMIPLGEILMGRVWRVVFPLSLEDRLEAYRSPPSRKELWWRIGTYFILFSGVNAILIVFILKEALK